MPKFLSTRSFKIPRRKCVFI